MKYPNEYRLLSYLLGKHKAIIVEMKDRDRIFMDQMCEKGFLTNYDNIEDKRYYHVNEKFKSVILDILKEI